MKYASFPIGLLFACALVSTAACSVGGTDPAARGGSAGPSEEVVERFIKSTEERTANPAVVAVSFESIQFGKPRPANEQDRIDGIQADAVYPARVRYTTTRRTTQGDEAVTSYNNYNFYEDGYEEWSATLPGPVR